MVEANVNLTKAVSSGDTKAIESAKAEYLHQSKDALSDWLDRKYGSTVTENAIFESLPRYWENEFHKDMNALNVLQSQLIIRNNIRIETNFFYCFRPISDTSTRCINTR